MSYIIKSTANPYSIHSFSFSTKFTLRSNEYSKKVCYIFLNSYYCGGDDYKTKISITIWDNANAYGRYEIEVNEVSSKIDAKDLLIEIANTYTGTNFDKKYCYIETSTGITF